MPSVPFADPLDDLADPTFLAQVGQVMAEARRRAADPAGVPAAGPTPMHLFRPVLCPPPGFEKRGARRRPAAEGVWAGVRPATGEGWNLGLELADVTPDGLGLMLRGPIPAGEEVAVDLVPPSPGRPVRVSGTVRWCQAAGAGTYLAGVQLCRPLTPLEYASLVGKSRAAVRSGPAR